MPPLLSEAGDSSGDESLNAQELKKAGSAKKAPPVDTPAEDDGDSEEGEDEYVVEKILGHRFVKGTLEFDVKWQGYADPKDRTWEPEANMDGAVDVLKEYFADIGGRPEPKGQKRKGRQSGVKGDSETPASTTKRVKQEQPWSPPPGSWEHDVSHVDTVEETKNPKTGQLERFAYLVWNNQKKTQHPLKHIYQKCPQKMLLYYESHLVFTFTADNNGNEESGADIRMEDD
ncbi:hypothetical protein IQ07DRAFT_559028 [Pyrenochaeta sp. DS3sAY3a]|nr:hypothetical protein IQ07DRAFT_559028 [Pyrenochaeta sp. DS3sAY3a]